MSSGLLEQIQFNPLCISRSDFDDMALSNVRAGPILTTFSSAIGILALSGGIYGLTNPILFADTLGIPVPTSTNNDSKVLPFVSLIAARNFGSGVGLLALIASGQRKAVGTVLTCGIATSFMDAWICAKNGAIQGKATQHAVLGIFIGLLGAAQIWLEQ